MATFERFIQSTCVTQGTCITLPDGTLLENWSVNSTYRQGKYRIVVTDQECDPSWSSSSSSMSSNSSSKSSSSSSASSRSSSSSNSSS